MPNFSTNERFVKLAPRSRLEGLLTPDDMLEMATDLATAMALARRPPPADPEDADGPLLYNRAMNVQNRGTVAFDPVLAPFIPRLVPGLTGFTLGIRTEMAANIAVELTIDVEDLNGNRVVPSGENLELIGPPPEVLTPPASPP